MRGASDPQESMYVVLSLEQKVPANHPLRAVKTRVDSILKSMDAEIQAGYSRMGRPSIPPEQLLKALLLRALYSIRSEIQLMHDIDFNLLYRWFLDLKADDPVWTPETFSMNRERFEKHGFIELFFHLVTAQAVLENLVSEDHFSVDGTLVQSWASMKSLKPRNGKDTNSRDDDPGNPSVNFRGQKRANATHVSSTDPEARLFRKGDGKEALLYHSAHVLMENRNGLCLGFTVDAADGRAERRAAKNLLKTTRDILGLSPSTLGADKGYDDGAFFRDLERRGITPHIPVRDGPLVARDGPGLARKRARNRMDGRRHLISQRIRKRIEEVFAWIKQIGGLKRSRFVGRWKILQEGLLIASMYNLIRIAKLVPA